MAVVPVLGNLRQEDYLSSGASDLTGKHSKTSWGKKKKRVGDVVSGRPLPNMWAKA